MVEKYYYTHEMYEEDISKIKDIIGDKTKYASVHLVSLYRGSLPMGVRLSNELDLPLSIIDYQTRDGESKEPVLIKNAGILRSDVLYVLDDIYDLGLTMNKAREYLMELFPFNRIEGITLVRNKANEHLHKDCAWVQSLRTTNGEWVVFEDWEGTRTQK